MGDKKIQYYKLFLRFWRFSGQISIIIQNIDHFFVYDLNDIFLFTIYVVIAVVAVYSLEITVVSLRKVHSVYRFDNL